MFSGKLLEEFKSKSTDFTRSRKQSFTGTLLFIMNRITKTLAIEIDGFVSFLSKDKSAINANYFTKSAFVQYRNKIKPEVFKTLFQGLIKEFYSDNEGNIKLWRGFRLLAVDGCTLTLPNTKKLQSKFGIVKNQTSSPITQGRVSVLYDVCNNFVIDGILSPLSKSEKALALGHLAYAKKGDLILYDRGYPSFEMVFEHTKKGIDFLFRVKLSFSNQVKTFVTSKKKTQIVKMYPGKNTDLSEKEYTKVDYITVRLNRVVLSDGTVEVLINSLIDENTYKNSWFKELYFKRWKVETFYDELKNKLKVGFFSGYSALSIFQDFYSSLFVSNIQSLLVTGINDELKRKQKTKYQYKVNANVSYGILKHRIIEIFFSDKPMQQITAEIRPLLKRELVPIRPNRSNQRICGQYRKRLKPHVTKNHKDAI